MKCLPFFLLLLAVAFAGGCAQELNPTGGAKDTVPPTVLRSNPPTGTLNYKGGDLRFVFSEPIQKPDVKKDLFISPFVARPRVLLSDNGRRLTLKLNEELRPQTTYVVTLNGIRDLTERNQIAEPFTLAFSTGEQLDSLRLRGHIEDAEGKGLKDLLVLMYEADSVPGNDIFAKRPSYLSRTDEQGDFSFSYLRATTYRVFGLKDDDQSNTYNQPTELIAIAADSVLLPTADTSQAPVKLFAFLADETPPGLRRFFWVNESTLAIQLSEAIRLSASQIFATDTLGNDSLLLTQTAYLPGTEKELWIHVPGGRRWLDLRLQGIQDSLGNGKDSLQVLRIDPSRQRLWKEPLVVKPKLRTDLPAIEFMPGKAVLPEQEALFSLTDTSSVDSLRKSFRFEWKETGLLRQIVPEEAARGIPLVLRVDGRFFYEEQDSSRRDTVFQYPVNWLRQDGYGTLSGKMLPDTQARGPVLVFMIGPGDKGARQQVADTVFQFRYLEPGDYRFEVIYDTDGNGLRSPGSLRGQRLPERSKALPDRISIRANWDFEDFVLDLNGVAPPPAEAQATQGPPGAVGSPGLSPAAPPGRGQRP